MSATCLWFLCSCSFRMAWMLHTKLLSLLLSAQLVFITLVSRFIHRIVLTTLKWLQPLIMATCDEEDIRTRTRSHWPSVFTQTRNLTLFPKLHFSFFSSAAANLQVFLIWFHPSGLDLMSSCFGL